MFFFFVFETGKPLSVSIIWINVFILTGAEIKAGTLQSTGNSFLQDQTSNTQFKRAPASEIAMDPEQGILEFERVFGKTIDMFLDDSNKLHFSETTKEKLKALIQLLESNYKIPQWRGGLMQYFDCS